MTIKQTNKTIEKKTDTILDYKIRQKTKHEAARYNFVSCNNLMDPDLSINSGQVFLWDKTDSNTWVGVNGSWIIKITRTNTDSGIDKKSPFYSNLHITGFEKNGGTLCWSSNGTNNSPPESSLPNTDATQEPVPPSPLRIFRQDDNLEKILADIVSRSEANNLAIVRYAVSRFLGLRLMRQEPFQCCISFICSSNSGIPNIRNMLKRLCAKFGTKVEVDGHDFFTFPEPEKLADASIEQLRSCGLGYRVRGVKTASQMVLSGELNFDHLRKDSTDYYNARDSLKTVFGIGNKVADCIMLFSLEKLDAFPVDRWTQRILLKYFPEQFSDLFGSSGLLTEKRYHDVHDKAVETFGSYAGYLQQFLFKMERDLYNKRW